MPSLLWVISVSNITSEIGGIPVQGGFGAGMVAECSSGESFLRTSKRTKDCSTKEMYKSFVGTDAQRNNEILRHILLLFLSLGRY